MRCMQGSTACPYRDYDRIDYAWRLLGLGGGLTACGEEGIIVSAVDGVKPPDSLLPDQSSSPRSLAARTCLVSNFCLTSRFRWTNFKRNAPPMAATWWNIMALMRTLFLDRAWKVNPLEYRAATPRIRRVNESSKNSNGSRVPSLIHHRHPHSSAAPMESNVGFPVTHSREASPRTPYRIAVHHLERDAQVKR